MTKIFYTKEPHLEIQLKLMRMINQLPLKKLKKQEKMKRNSMKNTTSLKNKISSIMQLTSKT